MKQTRNLDNNQQKPTAGLSRLNHIIDKENINPNIDLAHYSRLNYHNSQKLPQDRQPNSIILRAKNGNNQLKPKRSTEKSSNRQQHKREGSFSHSQTTRTVSNNPQGSSVYYYANPQTQNRLYQRNVKNNNNNNHKNYSTNSNQNNNNNTHNFEVNITEEFEEKELHPNHKPGSRERTYEKPGTDSNGTSVDLRNNELAVSPGTNTFTLGNHQTLRVPYHHHHHPSSVASDRVITASRPSYSKSLMLEKRTRLEQQVEKMLTSQKLKQQLILRNTSKNLNSNNNNHPQSVMIIEAQKKNDTPTLSQNNPPSRLADSQKVLPYHHKNYQANNPNYKPVVISQFAANSKELPSNSNNHFQSTKQEDQNPLPTISISKEATLSKYIAERSLMSDDIYHHLVIPHPPHQQNHNSCSFLEEQLFVVQELTQIMSLVDSLFPQFSKNNFNNPNNLSISSNPNKSICVGVDSARSQRNTSQNKNGSTKSNGNQQKEQIHFLLERIKGRLDEVYRNRQQWSQSQSGKRVDFLFSQM